jgi:hypothetical protein
MEEKKLRGPIEHWLMKREIESFLLKSVAFNALIALAATLFSIRFRYLGCIL